MTATLLVRLDVVEGYTPASGCLYHTLERHLVALKPVTQIEATLPHPVLEGRLVPTLASPAPPGNTCTDPDAL